MRTKITAALVPFVAALAFASTSQAYLHVANAHQVTVADTGNIWTFVTGNGSYLASDGSQHCPSGWSLSPYNSAICYWRQSDTRVDFAFFKRWGYKADDVTLATMFFRTTVVGNDNACINDLISWWGNSFGVSSGNPNLTGQSHNC